MLLEPLFLSGGMVADYYLCYGGSICVVAAGMLGRILKLWMER